MRGGRAFRVARGVGLGHVPARFESDEQDAGDPKGPPFPASAALAPTDVDGLSLRLISIGRPSRSPNRGSLPTEASRAPLQFLHELPPQTPPPHTPRDTQAASSRQYAASPGR